MRALLIANPKAGRTRKSRIFDEIVCVFVENGIEVTIQFTKGHGDATNIAKRDAGEFDLVVCVGGDGTLSEVVSGLMVLETCPKLGYIPTGTTNDFATSLGIPFDIKKAAKAIIKGESKLLDIGEFRDAYFVYAATFGYLTDVAYMTDQEQKNRFGWFAYLWEGLKRLWKVSAYEMRIEYDGNVLEGEFAFGAITNSYKIAGLFSYSTSQVDLADGRFEIMLIKNPQNDKILRRTLAKLIRHRIDEQLVLMLHATDIKITASRPVAWSIDGEDAGSYREVTIKNRTRSLQVTHSCV